MGPGVPALAQNSRDMYGAVVENERRRKEAVEQSLAARGFPRLPQAQRDRISGRRFIVHSVFVDSVVAFPHALLLPIKLLGLALLPVRAYAEARNRLVPARFGQRLQYRDLTAARRILERTPLSQLFWKLQALALHLALSAFYIIGDETARAVALFNMLVLCVGTFGAPVWIRAADVVAHAVHGGGGGGGGGARLLGGGIRRAVGVCLGLVLPAFLALQLYLLFLPNLAGLGTLAAWASAVFRGVRGAARLVASPAAVNGTLSSWEWQGACLLPSPPPAAASAAASGVTWAGVLRRGCDLLGEAGRMWFDAVDAGGGWQRMLRQGVSAGETSSASDSSSSSSSSSSATATTTTTPGAGTISLVPLFPALVQLQAQSLTRGMGLFLLPFTWLLRGTVAALGRVYATQIPICSGLAWLLMSALSVLQRPWAAQLLWGWVMLKAWRFTFHWGRRAFPRADPLWVYRLPFVTARAAWQAARSAAARAFDAYKRVLAACTRICATMGYLGDLMLIPLALAWFFLPLVVPVLSKANQLYIPAGVGSATLLVVGRDIIRANWFAVKQEVGGQRRGDLGRRAKRD